MSYNREQGNIDFLTIGKTFLMCKREKGLPDDKVLQFLSFFGHQGGERGSLPRSICTMTNEVKPMKINNHEKIKYERNCREQRGIFLVIKGTWSGISGNRGTQ